MQSVRVNSTKEINRKKERKQVNILCNGVSSESELHVSEWWKEKDQRENDSHEKRERRERKREKAQIQTHNLVAVKAKQEMEEDHYRYRPEQLIVHW